MAEEQPLKTYRGNCHCGAFIYELKVPEIKTANECNCSLCRKKGYLFTFPGESMTVVKGDGTLKKYTFNEGNTQHKVCNLIVYILHRCLLGLPFSSAQRVAPR